jgi:hypothetical protein
MNLKIRNALIIVTGGSNSVEQVFKISIKKFFLKYERLTKHRMKISLSHWKTDNYLKNNKCVALDIKERVLNMILNCDLISAQQYSNCNFNLIFQKYKGLQRKRNHNLKPWF